MYIISARVRRCASIQYIICIVFSLIKHSSTGTLGMYRTNRVQNLPLYTPPPPLTDPIVRVPEKINLFS